MRRPLVRSLVVGAVMLGGSVVGAVAPASAGDTSAGSPPGVVSQSAATTEGEQNRIEAYWTADRMAHAVPAETRFDGARQQHSKRQARAVQEEPQPQLGKVFFTLGSTDYVCSGTATQSANADVVTTAGHCLNEGPGAYATNFAFVPGYDNGAKPYGEWTASRLFTTQQWATAGDFEYDAGFAVMNPNDSGQSLTDVVGSYPIAFNLARGLQYTSYGYPAARPFDGQTLWSCTGIATDDPGGATTQGIPCDMTGGSSGGGWITGGSLNSVNSYKYRTDSSTMYGPYFGSEIQAVYQTAATS